MIAGNSIFQWNVAKYFALPPQRMIAGNSIFQWNVAKYFALRFVWSAHVVLDVQRSFQLPNWRFFPQPLKPRPTKLIYEMASGQNR